MTPHTLLILIECATRHKPGVNIPPNIWNSPASADARRWLYAEGLIYEDTRATSKGLKWLDQILAVPMPSDEDVKVGGGGPAFPEAVAVGPAGDVYPGMDGMSPRDWFAGQAMAGIATITDKYGVPLYGASDLAKHSYSIADAMIAAREAQP